MKYLVAIPCMDMMHTQFVCSLLSMPMFEQTEIAFGANSLIYDTRNQFAEKAIKNGFDRVLWLDSDMTFPRDFGHRLAARLDEGYEFVTGLYMTRKDPIRPTVFKGFDIDPPKATFYDDYPRDSLFEIAGCGFGGVMMTVDLIKRVVDAFGMPFSPILGVGEDLSFCARVGNLGTKMYCDSSIKMGHVGFKEINEDTYLERIKYEQEDQKQNEEHGEG